MNNDSTHVVPEPIKPVRIEHVTDDVKQLKTPDVQQQKTLLSGRALKDFGSAVKFEAGLAVHDGKYLTGGVLDFNLMTDTDIRFIEADQGRVNGPSGLTSGSLAGIISVTNVLPSGALTYDSVSKIASRSEGTRHIRQIYWPSDVENPGGYTRVGRWDNDVGNIVWSNWVIMSPENVNRVIITNNADPALSTLLPNTIYELQCGGCDITLPSALSMKVGTVLGFEQYPNPKALEAADEINKKGIYAEAWSSVVSYTAPDPITTGNPVVDFQVTLVSALDPIKEATKETGAHGTWYENAHCGITYTFENISIVPFEKNGTTYDRMWSLQTDQDADQVVPELSELMDKHTDQISADFVGLNSSAAINVWDYIETADTSKQNDKTYYYQSEPGVFVEFTGSSFVSGTVYYEAVDEKHVSKKADTRGLFKVEINRTGDTAIPSTFSIKAYLANEASATITYTEVNKPASNPDSILDPNLKYYYHDTTLERKVLAGKAGVVTSWTDVEDGITKLYYRSNVTGGLIAPIYSSYDTTGKYGTAVDAEFFKDATKYKADWFNNHKNFVGYIRANADQILTLDFSNEGSTIGAVKSFIEVKVSFIPDDHDSYLFKGAVVDASGSVEDVERRASTPDHKVADATSVAASRDEIIGTLQGKGMFYGNIRNTGVSATDLNSYIGPGVYTFVQTFGMRNGPQMIGGPNGTADTSLYATLTVTSSKSFSAFKKKEGADLTYTGDNNGDAIAGDGFERITQIITAELKFNGTVDLSSESYKLLPRMWLRHGIKPAGSNSVTWTNWVHFEPGRTIHEFGYGAEPYTGTGEYVIEALKVAHLLANGKPSLILKNPTDTAIDPTDRPTVTVNLPDPTPYVNTTFQIEAEANINVEVKYSVGNEEYTGNYSAASTPNHLLLNIECNNGLWYVVTA